MKGKLYTTLLAMMAAILLSACAYEEPHWQPKPLDQRTILLLQSDGSIYNQRNELVTQLPQCDMASQIIREDNDYFVSGSNSKSLVGYWKNGKWNTLHVDFIEDVDHWISGIGKWDSYIYLLDYPNVLKNSGIFPLKECDHFKPSKFCMAVSEGHCYVIGSVVDPEQPDEIPTLYTEQNGDFKAEALPLPYDVYYGKCVGVFAYDGSHCLIGGAAGKHPALWVDKTLQLLPLTYLADQEPKKTEYFGCVEALTRIDGHIYCVGYELNEQRNPVATIWIDGVPQHLVHNADFASISFATEVEAYGTDVYVLTREYYISDSDSGLTQMSVVWLNGTAVSIFENRPFVSFVVL